MGAPPEPGGTPTAQAAGVNVHELVRVLIGQRRLVVGITLISILVAAGISLLRPNVYEAGVTLIPSETEAIPGTLDLGRATDLAKRAGIRFPQSQEQESYAAIISSRRVMEDVLARKFHQPRLGIEARLDSVFVKDARSPARGRAEALKWLRRNVRASRDADTGTWTVTVRHRSPEIAAAIANALVDEAEGYRREQATREARNSRGFIESRMDSTRVALSRAEEELKRFRERNVRINKSPELQLQEGRLIRDTRLQEEVFITLTQQYELTKIEENWHKPSLVVLDRAVPPVYKSAPIRRRIVTMAAFLGFVVGCLIALGRGYVSPRWRDRLLR